MHRGGVRPGCRTERDGVSLEGLSQGSLGSSTMLRRILGRSL